DYAAFAEANFDITPSLIQTGGVRVFKAKNTLFGFSGFASNALSAAATTGGKYTNCTLPINLDTCVHADKTSKKSGETHKASLSWQIDPSRMVYFTYSTGFRPGGNN